MKKILLSFGHGYCAQALSRNLVPQGWQVNGTTRSEASVNAVRASGSEPIVLSSGSGFANASTAIRTASHLLISAGPTSEGDPVLAALRTEITKVAPDLKWVGYLSTTGVYGDHDGDWVDENAPLDPSTSRGQLRKRAEDDWRSIPDLPLHIFRLAGIYGPGRGPFAKVRNGTARRIIKDGQVFSRIHVDDIVQTLAASMTSPNPGAAYNVCDDDPAPPQDVIAHAAELLGVAMPPEVAFEAAEMTPMARSFYAENKRVRNDRIKTELGVRLIYPTYREGLAAMLRTGHGDGAR